MTKFFTAAPNMCGSSGWNSLVSPRVLRHLPVFFVICAPLAKKMIWRNN